MERSRGWCFTVNNPTDEDYADIERLKEAAEYIIYGKEVGEQGTPHLQGYSHFTNPRTLQGVKRFLKRAHLEARRGTVAQAVEYCTKDGDVTEWGEKPRSSGETTKERWRRIIKLAEDGDMEMIKEDYPGMYLRYYEKLKSLAVPAPRILTNLENEWWYGSTGTGKSRLLWELYPEHYQKELNKWWCGYNQEAIVAIEEWSPKNECTASALKIWADRYPFTGQIKGGSLKKIRPQKIIVTSNYSIDQCFPATEDAEPIKRRFKVRYFPEMFRHPREEQETEDAAEAAYMEGINALLSLSQ